MEFEKIKLALALKDLEVHICMGATIYVGWLTYLESSDGHGYKEPVLNDQGIKVVRIAQTKDEVANRLYTWVIENGTKKRQTD